MSIELSRVLPYVTGMHTKTALLFAAASLYVTAASAQPHAFGGGPRTLGECSAWSQRAKAESQGRCVVDTGPSEYAVARFAVHYGGQVRRINIQRDGLCTVDGLPCRATARGNVASIESAPGEGLSFPTPE